MQALPGAQFVYNQTNYGLLARIIIQRSGNCNHLFRRGLMAHWVHAIT